MTSEFVEVDSFGDSQCIHVQLLEKNRFLVTSSHKMNPEDKFKDEKNDLIIKAISDYYKRLNNVTSIKKNVFLFLENLESVGAKVYKVILFIVVLINVLATSLFSNFNDGITWFDYFLPITELLIFISCSIDFGLRLWSCNVNYRYKKCQRWKYVVSFTTAIDFIVISSSIVTFLISTLRLSGHNCDEHMMVVRIFVVFKLLLFERHFSSFHMVINIIKLHRRELIASYTLIFSLYCFFTFIISFVEMSQPTSQITSVNDAFYFTAITFSTIGYGDITPKTKLGRILTVFISLIAVAAAALPAGIIGSGFALELVSNNKAKQRKKRMKPAVKLIQSRWRVYSLKKYKIESATFKTIFLMKPVSLMPEMQRISVDKIDKSLLDNLPNSDCKVQSINITNYDATITINHRKKKIPLEARIVTPEPSIQELIIIIYIYIYKVIYFGYLKQFKIFLGAKEQTNEALVEIQRQNTKFSRSLLTLARKIDELEKDMKEHDDIREQEYIKNTEYIKNALNEIERKLDSCRFRI